jgi:hypothetical protein
MEMEQPNIAKPAANNKTIVVIALVIIALAGGFVGGMQYQKGKGGTAALAATSQPGAMGQMGQGGFSRGGTLGAVTAVSSSSISVKSERTSETKTYSITSSTVISDNGSATTYNDIAVGDTVLVMAGSSTSTTATTIRINPAMGGGMGAPGQDTQGSTSSGNSDATAPTTSTD